jgi:hypothetical protein
MRKLIWQCYAYLVDTTSGGRVYQNHWMYRHGIPPVPAWTVNWFFNLDDWCRARR